MILEILIISILGTILHFAYGWSQKNKAIAHISAVNESTWEHTKIAVSAVILFSFIDINIYSINPNYLVAKFASLIVTIAVIPIGYYSYKFFLKNDITFINISLFYIDVILGNVCFHKILDLQKFPTIVINLSAAGILIICIINVLLTFYPPKNKVFEDPINHTYGIN